MISQIPESHRDLITGPYVASLTTIMPGGQPQNTPVWCNCDDTHLFLNTMCGFRKARNLRANPAVTLLAFDPHNPLRNIEIRGTVVEMSEDNAEAHLNELTRLYMNRPDATFFGDCVPPELRQTHTPVRVKVMPLHIRMEG
jgi:PPOX class probable F420-dependent enzyme